MRQRAFAWLYHKYISGCRIPAPVDPFSSDVRAPLLAQAAGRILEIGAGDGVNLPLYPTDAQVTLLDPNLYLLRYVPSPARRVRGLGERLPFARDHFDTVVMIHVLCSVRSQADVLAEVQRVLRPGGLFVFLEHVAAPPRTLTRRFQHLFNPFWRAVGDGCHLTRETGAAIESAGFRAVNVRSFRAGYPFFVSWHIAGSAQT